jgi:phosphoribosyl-AMP cyclohydrolase
MSSPSPFSERKDKAQIEESTDFAPKFDENGLIPAMAIDATTKEPLMLAYMNELSLKLTLEYGEAVYWSRSRSEIWHKGKTSGHTQKIVEIRTDCDPDSLGRSNRCWCLPHWPWFLFLPKNRPRHPRCPQIYPDRPLLRPESGL